MQNLTTSQKEHLYEGGHVGVTITGETLDGVPVSVTEDDIIEGSFSIERNWAHGSTVEIGCADTSELIFELDNSDGRWSSIRWEGTRLTVVLDIDGEPLQAGIFTVDEPPRKLTTMQIRALDDMAKFNRPYDSTCPYPASLLQILQDACSKCGVTLYTQAFDNDSYLVTERPEGDDITYHHVVAWVAELAGCNAWIDHLGRLQLTWYGDQQPEPAQLEFARDSVAYHPVTGDEVPANTPIFMPFSGDKQGLLMEEGTINKYTAARSRGLNPLRTGGSIVTVTPGQPDPFGGTNAVRIQASGGTTLYKAVFGTVYVPAEGVSVSGQMWVKNRSDTSLTVHSNLGGRKADVLKSQDWIKIVWENIRGSGSNYPQHQLRAPTIDDSIDCDVAFLQYEEKPYCTSWQLGGVERANPKTLLTLPEALPAEFGIGVTMKMLWGANDPAAEGVYRRAAELWIDPGNRIFIGWRHTQKRWSAEVWVGGKVRTSTITDTPNFTAGDIIGLYFERRADKFRLAGKFAGGEIIYTNWTADDRTLPEFTNIYIGSDSNSRNTINAVLADFTLHDSGDIDPEGYLAGVPDDADGGGES